MIRVEGESAVVFFIRHTIIVIIVIAGVSFAVLVVVDLVGVGDVGTVVKVVLMAIFIDVLVVVTLVSNVVRVRVDLVRVVLQWAVVTVVTDSVSVSVSLVSVVHIWTVVLLIQDAITIDVNGTRISLAVVVGVGLFWITVIWAIIASVTNLIAVIVILSWVKDEWAIVPIIRDPIIVIIIITSISSSIFVIVFLTRVGKVRTVVLLAVVGGVFHTVEVRVWPAVKVRVLSTDVTVPSVAWFTFTAVHDVREDAQVDTVGILIAVMAAVLAWVSRCADLFVGNGLLRSPAEGLLSRVAWRAGQAVVAWFCVHTLVDSIEHETGIRNFFALVDVLTVDSIPSVSNWTLAALPGAIGEAGAFSAGEARVRQASISWT